MMLADTLTLETLFGALFDPEIWADPYPLFDELRTREPVARLDDHHWAISSHSATQAVLRSPSCSSDERRGLAAAPEGDDAYPDSIRNLLVFMDPPDHTRVRSLVVRAFTPRQVRVIEPRAIEIVDELLDVAADRGEFDIGADLGHPLAVQIICELLGVPFADRGEFSKWGAALARMIDPSALRTPQQDAVAQGAASAFAGYFEELIAERRTHPADDLLSELIAAEENGDRLGKDELISVCLLLLVAGYETTVNLVCNGFVALMHHRDQFRKIVEQPELLPAATNELLRFDSPVQMTMRIALEPMTIDGRRIASGESLVSFIGAANRDPDAFDAPDRLDVTRSSNPHLAFGGGIHHCLGAALARVEAQAAFGGLARRMSNIELIDAERRATFTLRGFSSVRAAVMTT